MESRISPKRLCELAGLSYWIGDLNVTDWEYDPKGYKTPYAPYVSWIQAGRKNLGKSVSSVRKSLAEDERGTTVFDGIALFLKNPEILKDHYIDLPGTNVGSGRAPYLGLFSGQPRLNDDWLDYDYPGWGSASCGRI